MMARSWCIGVAVVSVACGADPCETGTCTPGFFDLDLSGERPVFSLIDQPEDARNVPNRFSVRLADECQWDGPETWRLEDLEVLADISYGQAPEEANETVPAEALEPGVRYLASFEMDRRPLLHRSMWDEPFTGEEWQVVFTLGEPESVESFSTACE